MPHALLALALRPASRQAKKALFALAKHIFDILQPRCPPTSYWLVLWRLSAAPRLERPAGQVLGTKWGPTSVESPPQYRYLFLRGVNGLPGVSVFFMPSRMSVPAAGRHLYLGPIQHIYISGATWSDADHPNFPCNSRNQVPSTQRCTTGGIPFF
jgi:hypothetical protein